MFFLKKKKKNYNKDGGDTCAHSGRLDLVNLHSLLDAIGDVGTIVPCRWVEETK